METEKGRKDHTNYKKNVKVAKDCAGWREKHLVF
jgi:hypothetical protein